MKALVHVQHLLGSGHAVRAVAIARALAEQGVAVTVAAGNTLPHTLDLSGLTVIELPAVRARDASFRELVEPDGSPVDDAWRAARAERTLAVFHDVDPDILITETFPFGRRQFTFEMIPLVETASRSRRRPLVVSSVRDILVRKNDPAKERWMADTARAHYDVVLVHSDPGLVRLGDSFPFAERICDLTRYTGFVHTPSRETPPEGDGEDEVIVSSGGGAVGRRLIEAAVAARPLSAAHAGRCWRILASRRLFAEVEGIAAGDDGIVIEPVRRDFPGLLRRAALSISQAGYNTVLDVLTAGVAAVFVPFAEAGETEQAQRAELLVERGLAVAVAEESLDAASLAAASDRAAARCPPRVDLRLDGAEASAGILLAERARRRA